MLVSGTWHGFSWNFCFFRRFEYILFLFDIRVKSLYLTVWASMIHVSVCETLV